MENQNSRATKKWTLEKNEKELSSKELESLASSYNDIGVSLESLGRHKEALEHFQKSLEIQEKVFPNAFCEESKQRILDLYTKKLGEDPLDIQELKKTCSKGW